jgi:hypothetical protein
MAETQASAEQIAQRLEQLKAKADKSLHSEIDQITSQVRQLSQAQHPSR